MVLRLRESEKKGDAFFNIIVYDREIRMETHGRGVGNGFTCLCPWQDNSPQVQTFWGSPSPDRHIRPSGFGQNRGFAEEWNIESSCAVGFFFTWSVEHSIWFCCWCCYIIITWFEPRPACSWCWLPRLPPWFIRFIPCSLANTSFSPIQFEYYGSLSFLAFYHIHVVLIVT